MMVQKLPHFILICSFPQYLYSYVNKFAELKSCDACLPQVVKACGLTEDFRRLPQGDQTWVQGCGENLSGGQRQRISLARAVYRGCPVYVLDDPLSAVDPKLRHAIFKVGGHKC